MRAKLLVDIEKSLTEQVQEDRKLAGAKNIVAAVALQQLFKLPASRRAKLYKAYPRLAYERGEL